MNTTAYGWVNLEEISVKFSAVMVQSDYGVPGSPTFWEPEGIEIDYVEILGVEVDIKVLPKKLQYALYDLCEEIEEWGGE